MAFAKHCGAFATSPLGERPNRRRARAMAQPAGGFAINSPKRRDRDRGRSRQLAPAHRAKRGLPRMARGREGRGQECQGGAVATRPPQLGRVMRRTRDQPPATAARTGPMAATQMHPRPKRRRQPRVARHHQRQPPLPANPRQIPPDRRSARMIVMPQHHARNPPRQQTRGGARIGQPARVGEQPQHRQPASAPTAGGHRTSPGEQGRIAHARRTAHARLSASAKHASSGTEPQPEPS